MTHDPLCVCSRKGHAHFFYTIPADMCMACKCEDIARVRADERALLVEKARNLVDRFIEHGPLCWDSQAQCTCGLYELADALDDLEKP